MRANEYAPIIEFERRMAEYTGAPYAVAVDTCTAALFLCCKRREVSLFTPITIPARTYPSVPGAIIHAGGRVVFEDYTWSGQYQLKPFGIWDAAMRLRRDMYVHGGLQCLSFQYRKRLAIGRGGMILCDNVEDAIWFKLARFNGRESHPVGKGVVHFVGWHLFMEPERAARGLTLMTWLEDNPPDLTSSYPDLREYSVYTGD